MPMAAAPMMAADAGVAAAAPVVEVGYRATESTHSLIPAILVILYRIILCIPCTSLVLPVFHVGRRRNQQRKPSSH